MEYFDVCNRFGEKTGEIVERGEAHRLGVPHRAVQLWIADGRDRLLLQQRSADKDAGANLWCESVGGHIASGETTQSTILRETLEELGLDISAMTDQIEYLHSFREVTREDGGYVDDEFLDVFILRVNFTEEEMTLQPEEVQVAKYVDYADLRAAVIARDASLWLHEIGDGLLITALDRYFNFTPV